MASASASAVTVPAEALLSPGFDAVGVTEGLRAHVGVEQLLRDLRSQLQGLRSTLVNLINHDYDELAGISSKLKGVDSKIERLKQPIEHLRQQHEQTKVASASSMARLQRMLAERGLVASARSQLQLFVQVGDSLASLQRLWVQASPSSPTGENVGFSGSPHHVSLERIAAEISALGKSCKRAPPHFSFIVQTLQCLGDHQTRLLDELGSTLSSSLAAGDDAASQSTLRAYAALEREAQAEELVLATFVQPAVAALVSQSTGDDGQLDLVRLYGGVEALVLGNPFACALRASSSLFTAEPCTRYDFVANSVWVEVFAAVKDSIFRPASQRFADNFRQSVKFLAFLESTYPTDAARQTFRTHRVTRNCEEKWSLHTKTYFQLHKNDIIRQVEQALAIGCPRKSGDETDITEPSFDEKKPSVIVWSCISSCWSPEAYLPPLAADFLLLSLQMVARYSTWIRQLSITELSVVDTTSASADQPCSLDDLVCAVVDAQILTRRLAELPKLVSQMLQATALDNFIGEAVGEAAKGVVAATSALGQRIGQEAARPCCEVLRGGAGVKQVLATYRMTHRAAPTTYSSYVAATIQPLALFTQTSVDQRIVPIETARDWATEAVRLVCCTYLELCRDVVSSVMKTAAGLGLIKPRRKKVGQPSDSADSLSDTQKICAQLSLDIDQLGELAESQLGIIAEDIPAFRELRNYVRSVGTNTQ